MGINVNMISGGLLKVTDASAATPDAVFDAIATMTPLQKITTVEDFAEATLFFASEHSRSITGQNMTVDDIRVKPKDDRLHKKMILYLVK